MEARVSELTAAIDAGDLRHAIRLANSFLLRSQKGAAAAAAAADPAAQLQAQQLIKSIKVIALARQGKTDEAVDLIRQLPKTENDVNDFLCIAYKELRNEARLSPCRVAATPPLRIKEAREEAEFLHLYNFLDRDEDMFQHALRLYSSTRKQKHLLWAIAEGLLSSYSPKHTKRLLLLQQLLQQQQLQQPPELLPELLQDPKVNIQLKDANAALTIHLSVLRQCNRYQEALALLDKFSSCCLQPGEFEALKIQLLIESGLLQEAVAVASKAIENEEIAADFFGVFVRLAAANGEEATAAALQQLECIGSFGAAAAALELLVQRGLEVLQGHDKVLTANGLKRLWGAVAQYGDPVQQLYNLIERFGFDVGAFRFFRVFAPRLTQQQQKLLRSLLLQLRSSLAAAALDAEANTRTLRSLITVDKALLALGDCSKINSSAAERLREWRQLFLLHSTRKRLECLAAEFVGLSVEVLLRWDRQQEETRKEDGTQEQDPWIRRRFLFEALAWIDAGLSVEGVAESPVLQQLRLGVSFAAGNVLAVDAAVAAADAKHVLLLSLGLFLTSAQLDYGYILHVGKLCRMWVDTQEETASSYAEYSSAAAEENNFSCLSEYWLLGLQTQHSLDGLLVSLQGAYSRLYDLGGPGPSSSLIDASLSLCLSSNLHQQILNSYHSSHQSLQWLLTAIALTPTTYDQSNTQEGGPLQRAPEIDGPKGAPDGGATSEGPHRGPPTETTEGKGPEGAPSSGGPNGGAPKGAPDGGAPDVGAPDEGAPDGGAPKGAPVSRGALLGALYPLTSIDLGIGAPRLLRGEELVAHELAHPARRALLLLKALKALKEQQQQQQQQQEGGGDERKDKKREKQDQEGETRDRKTDKQQQNRDCLLSAIREPLFAAAAAAVEEKALFAHWIAEMRPDPWKSIWPSRLFGSQSMHALLRLESVEDASFSFSSLSSDKANNSIISSSSSSAAAAVATAAAAAAAATGGEQLFAAPLTAAEQQVLQSVAGFIGRGAPSPFAAAWEPQQQETAESCCSCCTSSPCKSRRDQGGSAAAAAAAAATAAPAADASGALNNVKETEEEETDEQIYSNSALEDAIASLRRSIPGRARRLRLLFVIMQPSLDYGEARLQEIDRYIAELQQGLNGSVCSSFSSAWPSAACSQTNILGSSRCCCSTCAVLFGVYRQQCLILQVLRRAMNLHKQTQSCTKEGLAEETVSISNHFCEALDSCREVLMMCCTSVFDGVGELRGLGRPAVAAASRAQRLLLFDGLFGLAQAASVSFALILFVLQQLTLWNEAFKRSCSNEITVFGAVLRDCKPSLHAFLECMKGQHKSLVEAMNTARQLESIGQPPWINFSSNNLMYTLQDDPQMEEARQRVRTSLCSSYIESALMSCSILHTRIRAIASWLQQSLSD